MVDPTVDFRGRLVGNNAISGNREAERGRTKDSVQKDPDALPNMQSGDSGGADIPTEHTHTFTCAVPSCSSTSRTAHGIKVHMCQARVPWITHLHSKKEEIERAIGNQLETARQHHTYYQMQYNEYGLPPASRQDRKRLYRRNWGYKNPHKMNEARRRRKFQKRAELNGLKGGEAETWVEGELERFRNAKKDKMQLPA